MTEDFRVKPGMTEDSDSMQDRHNLVPFGAVMCFLGIVDSGSTSDG